MSRDSVIAQKNADTVHLLHVTDTHILASPGQTFAGVDTTRSLQEVMSRVRQRHWSPDAILVTGDLVHEPSADAYDHLAALLGSMTVPVFCIPGNHDDPVLMRARLEAGNISTAKVMLFADWVVCLLDSCVPGTHAGHLGDAELEFLEETLDRQRNKHALIGVHHPPFAVGSPWLDRMGLQNPADLFAITDRHAGVRGIVCGHVHQEFSGRRGAVSLLATPSTCVQFVPRSEGFGKDDKPPAWRQLRLHADGGIETRIDW